MRAATDAIAKNARVLARSSVYETDPIGPPQPRYLNAAIAVEHDDVLALFDHLLKIEIDLGRIRRERWGPRVIDLDILLAEKEVKDARLVVPHPHLEERAFALVPLLEVWPDAKHPTTKRAYAEISIDTTGLDRTSLSLV